VDFEKYDCEKRAKCPPDILKLLTQATFLVKRGYLLGIGRVCTTSMSCKATPTPRSLKKLYKKISDTQFAFYCNSTLNLSLFCRYRLFDLFCDITMADRAVSVKARLAYLTQGND
jgi:hypothetical protein